MPHQRSGRDFCRNSCATRLAAAITAQCMATMGELCSTCLCSERLQENSRSVGSVASMGHTAVTAYQPFRIGGATAAAQRLRVPVGQARVDTLVVRFQDLLVIYLFIFLRND